MKSTRLATTAAVSVACLLAVGGAVAASANSGAAKVTISVASLIPRQHECGDTAVQQPGR